MMLTSNLLAIVLMAATPVTLVRVRFQLNPEGTLPLAHNESPTPLEYGECPVCEILNPLLDSIRQTNTSNSDVAIVGELEAFCGANLAHVIDCPKVAVDYKDKLEAEGGDACKAVGFCAVRLGDLTQIDCNSCKKFIDIIKRTVGTIFSRENILKAIHKVCDKATGIYEQMCKVIQANINALLDEIEKHLSSETICHLLKYC